MSFLDSSNLTIKVEGIVDGLGYDWWLRDLDGGNPNGRPTLVEFQRAQKIEICCVKFLNSPKTTIDIKDADDVLVHDIDIRTDILKQFGWVSQPKIYSFGDHFNWVW